MCRIACVPVLLGLLGFCSVLIAGDDYLDALEAEASGVQVDPASAEFEPKTLQRRSRVVHTNALRGGAIDLPAGLDAVEFEQALQQSMPSSYLFYWNLPDAARQEVFVRYANGASAAELRELILRLRSATRKP